MSVELRFKGSCLRGSELPTPCPWGLPGSKAPSCGQAVQTRQAQALCSSPQSQARGTTHVPTHGWLLLALRPPRASAGAGQQQSQEECQGTEHAHQRLKGKSMSGLHWCGDLFQSNDKIVWILEARGCLRHLLDRKQSNVCKQLLLLGLVSHTSLNVQNFFLNTPSVALHSPCTCCEPRPRKLLLFVI